MMSSLGRRFLSTSLTLGLLASSLPAGVGAQDGTGACDRGWSDVQLREDIVPEGAMVLAPDDLWFAGGAMISGGRRSAAVLHGLGADAEVEEPPLPETRDSGLTAIASVGPGKPIWAVGFGRETDFVAAYVTRRDDGGWRDSETIRPDGFNAALTDVGASPAHGVWAVGFLQGVPGDQRPWALQLDRDGRTGSRLPLPDGADATLAGISVNDEGGVWVAGTMVEGAQMRPYLAVRDGGRWDRYATRGLEGVALADIEVKEAKQGWAVGHRLDGSTIRALVLRWDGTAWSEVTGPDIDDAPTLLTSVAEAGGVVTVGGTWWDTASGRYVPLVARLIDGAWLVSVGRRGWGMGTITDIIDDPGSSGWAVGRTDDGLMARVCDEPPRGEVTTEPVVEARPLPQDVASPQKPTPLRGEVRAVDVAEAAGLETTSQSWGAVAADFDGDGRDDLFIGRHGARARLYLNEGGRFVESDVRFGGGDRHACAAADIDGSGWLDLYCAFGASRGTGTKHNQLWLDPGHAPRLHESAGGATEPLGRGRQPRFFDIDEDGDLDLFIGQETKRMDGLPSLNRGYLAVEAGEFEATPLPGIDTGLATEAIDIADYDGDGREDMLFVYWDMRAVEPTAGIRLYRNEEGPGFSDVTAAAGIESIGERDALLVELDGDGRLDLVQLSPARVVVSLARRGRFERVSERAVSAGTALAAGDADGDGDTDLYVLQGKSEAGGHDIILRNDGTGTGFGTVDVPDVRGGSEDDVIALDYDTDGRTDFLALNGRNSAKGPVQLITLEAVD